MPSSYHRPVKPWNVTRSALRMSTAREGGASADSRRDTVPKGPQLAAGRRRASHPDAGTLIRRTALAWRTHTGGSTIRDSARKTLIACSGGADSTALAVALCAAVSEAPRRFVIGHVVHDLRPPKQALADRDHAKKLATWLGVEFCEAKVVVKGARKKHTRFRIALSKNPEAAARLVRYDALAKLAKEHGCGYVATAHHLDDALETVLMRMMRGCGPGAMRGVMPVRRLKSGKTQCIMVRPMLGYPSGGIEGLTRVDCESLCNAAGVSWRHDATNDDTTRLRAALRKNVLPALRSIDSGVARRMVRSAGLCAEAGEVVRRRARTALKRARIDRGESGARKRSEYSREQLAKAPAPVLHEAIAMMVRDVGGAKRQDRMRARSVGEIARWITDSSTHVRRVVVGGCKVVVDVRTVVVRKATS